MEDVTDPAFRLMCKQFGADMVYTEFVSSDAPPFDPGELGVAVAPPAIANALYAATGKRFRRLPLMETVA